MKLQIPEDIKTLSTIIQNAGFECYCVGGCVRDSLLGKEPHDWDLCTNALPDQILDLFIKTHKTLEIGKHFGVVAIITDEFPTGVEIATFRNDVFDKETLEGFLEYLKKTDFAKYNLFLKRLNENSYNI